MRKGERRLFRLLLSKGFQPWTQYRHPCLQNMPFDFAFYDTMGRFRLVELDGMQHFKICRKYSTNLTKLLHRQKLDMVKTLFVVSRENFMSLIRLTTYDNFGYHIDKALEYTGPLYLSSVDKYDYLISGKVPKDFFISRLTSEEAKNRFLGSPSLLSAIGSGSNMTDDKSFRLRKKDDDASKIPIHISREGLQGSEGFGRPADRKAGKGEGSRGI